MIILKKKKEMFILLVLQSFILIKYILCIPPRFQLNLKNNMFTHYYFRQRAQATQGPVLSQQRKPTPHVVSDEGTDEEEEEEEEVTSQTDSASQRQNTAQDRPNTPHSQPSAPQPNPKAPARGKKRKATNREDTVQLQGIDLYRSLLSEGKISGSTNIMKCMDLDLHPKDLKEIFPHIELSVLSSASSLIITLKSLEEMNRQSEPKTNTTAKISMETLQNNKALVTKMRTFPECEDDLSLQHTSTRVFHRLPLASMKQLFVECAKKHVDLTPILAYDLTDINGGSHIREKGWQTIHNPGTQNPSIRDFMTRSYGNNQSKKLKLDEDFSIVETSQVKDADTIKEVKKGLILMIRLYHQVHPTLLNYLTLLNFMTEMDWLYNCDRKGLPQVTYAVAFVDFYLNAIGDHFRNCTPPPDKTELYTVLKAFHDSVAVCTNPTNPPNPNTNRGRGNRRGGGRQGGQPGPSWNQNTPGSNNNSGNHDQPGPGSPNDRPHTQKFLVCDYFNKPKGCNRTSTTTPNYCVYNGLR